MRNRSRSSAVPYTKEELAGVGPQRTFTGGNLLQIAMPLGGIGAGCVCLNGHGGLQDFSICHGPDVTALPDGHSSNKSAFALLHIKGDAPITRLIEGPLPVEKLYDQGVQSQGYRKGGHEGLPRFADCSFTGEFPFGEVEISDPGVPLRVKLTGWSPFIPLHDVNSGMPAAILEYRFTNRSSAPVEFEFSYHISHWVVGDGGWKGARSARIEGRGVEFTNTDSGLSAKYGSASLTVVGHCPKIKAMWFRGGWFDGISALWRQVSEGRFTENDGNGGREYDAPSGGSILIEGRLDPGESVTYPVVITWFFPNGYFATGEVPKSCDTAECLSGECGSVAAPAPRWKPFYATQWGNSTEVAAHIAARYDVLRAGTAAFKEALFSTTAPSYVLDAVSANLAIMKSPTVLRQASGQMWAWEGCFCTGGCCHGSCTHVWNYAQAFPHLFPHLERTFREQEYRASMDERGHVNFRSALPEGPAPHDYRAASDGQLGGIMKLYRDWQISGNREWLASLYPLARRSLDYCIGLWDPDGLGVPIEPHHNTYDIEFWGPDGMCGSIYLGALAAMAAMADEMGDRKDAERYRALAARGAEYMDENLYNGEYYQQRVAWQGLRDRSFADSVAAQDGDKDEMLALLKAEGPKYQYGSGCLSDGVIGHWMATAYGIDTPQTRANVVESLRSIFANNFRADLFDNVCLQRPGYAMGHEPGLLLCTWPHGGKPTLPFVYSDEVWTGIEYQVASHMISMGLVDEGLTIVKAARTRYDGRARNPWNEFECGNYYARAMSSYALLGALSGFRYSAVTRTLWFGPQVAARPFQTFFSAATGYGTIRLADDSLTVSMLQGTLEIELLVLTRGGESATIPWAATAAVASDATLAF